MKTLLYIPFCVVFISQVLSDHPLYDDIIRIDEPRNDDLSYRLNWDILPVHYEVEMTPYFEATANREAFTFDGVITLEILAVEDNISEIILQENVASVETITVTTVTGLTVVLDPVEPFIRDTERQFLIIRLLSGLSLINGNTYFVTISYRGRMNVTPISRGVFRGSYRDANNNTRWYAASHLQPYHGRQAFPCLDEPGMKSTIDLTVNRPANFGETFSNMPIATTQVLGDRVREVFYRIPRMSAYLFTVHFSEEFAVIADNNNANRSFRIIARPNAQGQGEYAQNIGIQITEWLENYLNISYYNVDEHMKNDQIAVPDWASGATENWGLVSYRERRLLVDEAETSLADKASVASIVAHELGHKWFGNLITAKWWDNVWVNEGFASFFEHFAVEPVAPALEAEDTFIIYYLQSALSTDAAVSDRALNYPSVNDRDSVTNHFSGISYTKGASLLNMLKHLVTEDTFRKALNYFLLDRSFEYAEPEHIYDQFYVAVNEDNTMADYPGIDIREFFRYWVDEPGYPILDVYVNMMNGDVTLTQERFFLSATAAQTEQIWPIPYTYSRGGAPDWDATRPVGVMTNKTLTFNKGAGHEWVIFNVKGTGIYRINYDDHSWEMITGSLLRDVNNVHYLNRAQIVDDVFAFMRAQRLTFEKGFQILEFLKYDTSYYSWYPALTGFSWYRSRLSHLPDKLAQLDALILEYMETLINTLGWDVVPGESTATTLNRYYLMNFACNLGHEGCIQQAVTKFAQFRNGVSVHPDLRRYVLCSGIRHGDTSDFDWLFQRMINSNVANDEYVMLRTLPCTNDPELLYRYLDHGFSVTKAQERLNMISFAAAGHPDNANTALQYFKANHQAIRESMETSARTVTTLSTIASYLDEAGLEDLERWLNENQSVFPEYASGLSLVNSYRTNIAWGTQNADQIIIAMGGSAAVGVQISITTLLVCLLAMLY